MAKFEYDIAILGGGAAGLTVASGSAQLGARTLLVEKESALGGDCLHFGCVPSKTLIKSAAVYHQMKNSAQFGLPAIELPPVNFQEIARRIQRVQGVIQHHDSVERFNRLGAEIAFGQPQFIDEHVIELDGKRISAKSIVVATGSRAAVPEIEGLRDVGFLTNRELFSLKRLPSSLVVLGAGPIGIEMAQAFSRLGAKVSVIQRGGQILSREDRDMAEEVMQVLSDEGVAFFLDSEIVSCRRSDGEKVVTIRRNGVLEEVAGEELLIALGRAVNTQDLGLDRIGLKHDMRGIDVDVQMRTSHSHIYAAGDVTGGYQFTHAAGYEGGIVISNAIFHLPRKANYRWMPWCTYSHPELASIGMNENAVRRAGLDYSVLKEEFAANDRALAEEEPGGWIKLILDRKEKPLGVQILGPHAGELLGEWVAALSGGVKLSALAGAVHPYPTLVEINKRVVGGLFSKKLFSDRVRKILRLIFRYQGSSV